MIPVKFSHATRVAKPPLNWNYEEGPCEYLSIMDYESENGNVMVTAWMPTDEEIASLKNGSLIFLHVHGTEMPVIHMAMHTV